MLCSTLNFLESAPDFREKINDYVVNVFDKQEKKEYKDDTKAKEYKDNIINVTFGNSSK